MATLGQLESQQRQLESELRKYRQQAEDRIRSSEALYSKAYDELKEKSRSMIAEDREETKRRYQELLDRTESEADEKLNDLIDETQKKYEKVRQELNEEIAKEKARVDAAIKDHESVTKEYRDTIETQRQYAEEAIRTAKDETGHFLDIYPVRWFLPKREEIYRDMLSRIQELYDSGVYQAATGLSDDLKMRIEMDKADIEKDIEKWFRYFSVLKSIIDNEHTMKISGARDLGTADLSEYFFIDENIGDRMLTKDMFDEWIGPGYKELIAEHDRDYDFLQSFLDKADYSGEGIPSNNVLIKCMRENMKKADSYSAERLYDRARSAMERADREAELIDVMRSRIKAYDMRCEMYEDLCSRLEEISYNCSDSYFIGDKRDGTVALFEDFGRVTNIEVQMIPVFSIKENKWYNGIGYTVSSDVDSYELEEQLDELMHDVFDLYGVVILPANKRVNRYSAPERTSNYRSSLNMMFNSHS